MFELDAWVGGVLIHGEEVEEDLSRGGDGELALPSIMPESGSDTRTIGTGCDSFTVAVSSSCNV